MEPDQTDLELLKLAADARKLEIDNFWKRSLFFWGVHSGYSLRLRRCG